MRRPVWRTVSGAPARAGGCSTTSPVRLVSNAGRLEVGEHAQAPGASRLDDGRSRAGPTAEARRWRRARQGERRSSSGPPSASACPQSRSRTTARMRAARAAPRNAMSASSSSRSSSDHGRSARTTAGTATSQSGRRPRHASPPAQSHSVVIPPSTANRPPVANAPVVAREVDHDAFDVGGAPGAAERDAADDRRTRLRVGRDRGDERRLGVRRDDGVHADARSA